MYFQINEVRDENPDTGQNLLLRDRKIPPIVSDGTGGLAKTTPTALTTLPSAAAARSILTLK